MSSPSSSTIYIGNLDVTKVDRPVLYELLSHCGPIVDLRVVSAAPSSSNTIDSKSKDDTGSPQVSVAPKLGFAFCQFEHEGSCLYACRVLDGVCLFERPIRIRPSGNTAQSPYKVYIGNLGASVCTSDLYACITALDIQSVTQAVVSLDSETGKSRGFGFVHFATSADALACQRALDRAWLDGRVLTASVSDQ